MLAPTYTLNFAYFVDSHEIFGSVWLCLVERNKFYVLGRPGFIAKWRRDCIQVMCANGNELSFAADVLM